MSKIPPAKPEDFYYKKRFDFYVNIMYNIFYWNIPDALIVHKFVNRTLKSAFSTMTLGGTTLW